MSKLLYIQASPRGPRSKSIALADAFVNAYRDSHPKDQVETLDLFTANLCSFDGLVLQAKYNILHGREHSQQEFSAWHAVEQVIEQFTSAHKYVFAVPMWNFSIPYRLKQYIDIIVQPGYTFSFSTDEGYKGLILDRPAFIAYARGGDYSSPPFSDMNHQSTYLEAVLAFIGFDRIASVTIEPTLMAGPDLAREKLTQAIDTARKSARDF